MDVGAIPVRLCIAAFTPAPKPPVANDDSPVANFTCLLSNYLRLVKTEPVKVLSFILQSLTS